METPVESSSSSSSAQEAAVPPAWSKIGLVAMASIVLGGMATAWWYRKTLIRLRQAEETAANPQFGISEDDPGDDA
jgi:hypothetical protein